MSLITLGDRTSCLFVATVPNAGIVSPAVKLWGRPIFGLFVPTVNDTPDLTIEFSHDEGSTWFAVYDADLTTPSVKIDALAASGYLSADIFTPLAPFVGGELLARIKLSVIQTADRAFQFVVMG